MLTDTPQISPTECKYWVRYVAQVYEVSFPKIAFFYKFPLKNHEKPYGTTEVELV